jgi:cellulose 1,4-beta-cellobiosidase
MPILAAVAMLAASGVFAAGAPAQAATTTLCNSQTAAVAGGAYTVQNNEWNSSAPECVTTDGNADFTVANSSINLSGGAPGGYPSIYKGCHWGACTTNSGLPIPVSSMTPGEVTTSWSTTQTSGAYDVAYDIWYNQTPTTSGQPNAEEMMIWINHTGGVEPFGSVVASNVSIGGRTWTIWEGRMSTWNTVSYVLNTGVTSVSNLDVDLLAADSVQRGYMTDSDYLIDLEAGFELWNGGVGNATNSYSVNIGGGTTPPPPPPGSGPVTGYQGLCLDDRAASTAPLNPVQVYTCNGTGAQTWQHQSNGEYLNPRTARSRRRTGNPASVECLVAVSATGRASCDPARRAGGRTRCARSAPKVCTSTSRGIPTTSTLTSKPSAGRAAVYLRA